MTYPVYRIVLAVVAAAVVACFFTIITAMADQIEASARISEGGPFGAQCSLRAWPFYEDQCLRDLRPRGVKTNAFRIVTIDRD